jgi:hypothetical protein
VIVLSDGGGWNGDAAAGCPVVVVVGAVGGVVAAGGGGVAARAGAAGAVRRAGRGFGASTVTCGTETVGAAPVCDVSGCADCGAGASGAGVGGASGVVVVGGVSGAGACDDATPAKQSSISAELLSRSKRLLRIHITIPLSPNINPSRRETAPRAGFGAASLARGRAVTSSMSGEGRCACLEEGAV